MHSKYLKASEDGFQQIQQALQEAQDSTGWPKDSDEWLKYAAKLNDSSWTEDDEIPKGFSIQTWKRFINGEPIGTPLNINAKAFKIFCKVLGLNWEEIIEHNPTEQIKILEPRYLLGYRCQTVWGRNDMIEDILQRLNNPKELPILCLWGGSGYGKTELAYQISQEAIHRKMFENILWVTARDSQIVNEKIVYVNSQNYTLHMFLQEITEQLDCSFQKIKQNIKNQKFLIVIDNAETSDLEEIMAYLIDLLRFSRVLITSRLETKPQYVRIIKTPGLDRKWADKLLLEEAKCNEISVILQATEEQLSQIYELSCGAPLALHFVAGRAYHDRDIEPVLSELQQAGKRVEVFYQYSLETAWLRINETAQNILRYIGYIADAGITLNDLAASLKVSYSQVNQEVSQLRRWYLIEDKKDNKNISRIDLHPWVRTSVRQKIVDNWKPSTE
ncbi:MAG TPA: NB-ARC domain-containing protein, partial [Candidatus Sericytochromatia bacterium]